MKWFLSVCVLAGIVAVMSSSSCGPKRDFCPDQLPEYVCFDMDGGAMGGAGGQDQGMCDGGLDHVLPRWRDQGVQAMSECPPSDAAAVRRRRARRAPGLQSTR